MTFNNNIGVFSLNQIVKPGIKIIKYTHKNINISLIKLDLKLAC